ncbi:glutamate-rich protein 4 [Grammomys surdaster]|uniref:glutamate-rich protein 4 n=1 Tax=Grammomys surdaster TaxID=491861 RepID=UPI00109F4696|nr:glutamate-rich protein 4 [Grammomys surdaster]
MVWTMELWVQLKQAGLEPSGLGPLPKALRMPPPEGNPGQALMSSGAELGGARELLLWIWEELGNLRRVDVQLLGQLCDLGLEMGTLREELVTILEEEEDEEEEEEQEKVEEEEEEEKSYRGRSCVKENKGSQGKQKEGHSGRSYPAQRLPDFEMTI